MRLVQRRFYSSKRLAAAGVLLLLTLTGVITSAQKAIAPPRIKNFGKVNDNYYRGPQPTKSHLVALKAMGVNTLIDLRRDYVPEEREWARQLGMNYFNIPLRSGRRATKEQTEYFLRLVNDPANGSVYVHCKGGRHRTGAMTAVYRITHDNWTAEQAWEEMKKYGFNDGSFGGLFGGPDDQRKFVFEFYKQSKQ
jgi:tyrosine-protein phosphatase SIW14